MKWRNTGRTPCDDRGRDWSEASSNQRTPPEFRREAHTGSPSQSPEGTNPTDTLTLDFYTPELWENKYLLFRDSWLVLLCYSSPRKLS